jgi:hypothetical protein
MKNSKGRQFLFPVCIITATHMERKDSIAHEILTQSARCLPHDLSAPFYAVKLYRSDIGISFVIHRYSISKTSLMRWNKRFDGTRESLADRSYTPHTSHPTGTQVHWGLPFSPQTPTSV